MSISDDDALRGRAADLLGSAFAQKASRTLLAATRRAEEGFHLMGAEALTFSSRYLSPPDGFVVELHEEPIEGEPDPIPGEGMPAWMQDRRETFLALSSAFAEETQGVADEPETALEPLWLVNSVRLRVPISVLREVAQRDDVRTLDLPRPLRPDSVGTGTGSNCAPKFHAAVAALHSVLGSDGSGQRIALLDGEVDGSHPALAGRVQFAGNFTKENGGLPANHPTALAGLLLGTASVAGVVPDAEIQNFKVLPTFGAPHDDGTFVAGLTAAVEAGIPFAVCSLSLLPAPDQPDRAQNLIARAAFNNVVVCKSAGNNGLNSPITEPAARGALVVGACDRSGTRMPTYVSTGPSAHGVAGLDVLAPGGEDGDPLWSAHRGGGEGPIRNGTSNSAALAAGVMACIAASNPGQPLSALRAHLTAIALHVANVPAAHQGVGAILVT